MNIWIVALIIFIFLDLTIVAFIIYKRKFNSRLDDKSLYYIQSHWIKIIDSSQSHPKNAILDADKLLDYALKKHGYTGTVGEKLKKSASKFSSLDGIWSAHKLRNKVAHELGDVNNIAAKKALKNFKRALNDLGAKL